MDKGFSGWDIFFIVLSGNVKMIHLHASRYTFDMPSRYYLFTSYARLKSI